MISVLLIGPNVEKGEGVKNPKKLAYVICEQPFTHQPPHFQLPMLPMPPMPHMLFIRTRLPWIAPYLRSKEGKLRMAGLEMYDLGPKGN